MHDAPLPAALRRLPRYTDKLAHPMNSIPRVVNSPIQASLGSSSNLARSDNDSEHPLLDI
jgi:hypothetical protein